MLITRPDSRKLSTVFMPTPSSNWLANHPVSVHAKHLHILLNGESMRPLKLGHINPIDELLGMQSGLKVLDSNRERSPAPLARSWRAHCNHFDVPMV